MALGLNGVTGGLVRGVFDGRRERKGREAGKDDRGLPDMVAARYRGGEIVQLHAMKTVNMGN